MGDKQMRCRHLTADDLTLLQDIQHRTEASNQSEAIQLLLRAYEEKREMVLNAGRDGAAF